MYCTKGKFLHHVTDCRLSIRARFALFIPFELVSLLKELCFFAPFMRSRSSIWFHTFMDHKYDCFNRDKEPFYWFHVSPYCILWAVSELTIFYFAYRFGLISHKEARRAESFHFAQLEWNLLHRAWDFTPHSQAMLFGACRIATLSFLRARYETKHRKCLRDRRRGVLSCFDVFHYWNFYKLWQEQH